MKKKLNKQITSRPVIETLINTAAIAVSAYGITRITTGNYDGYLAIVFAMLLEFCKYYGRNNSYW